MSDTPYGAHWRTVVCPAILERDSHECQIRGPRCTGTATDVDHIIPWSEGGAWYDDANLRAACAPCNRGRSSKRLQAMAHLNRQTPATPSREW